MSPTIQNKEIVTSVKYFPGFTIGEMKLVINDKETPGLKTVHLNAKPFSSPDGPEIDGLKDAIIAVSRLEFERWGLKPMIYAGGDSSLYFLLDEDYIESGIPFTLKVTPELCALVRTARIKREEESKIPAGFKDVFSDPDEFDPLKALLIWLDFWLTIALTDLKDPILQIS